MGMGVSILPTLWLESYFLATIKTSLFLGWNWYEKIFWFWPYLFFGFLSGWLLSVYFFRSKIFALLGGLLYIANTYALLLIGGGQMGIALSYSIAPFGIIAFEELLKKLTLKSVIIFSITFSLIFLLDIRIGYILVWYFGVRFLFELPYLSQDKLKKYLYLFPLSGIFIAGLHAFWLVPTIVTHGAAISSRFGDIYTSSKSIQFFSFAKFEDALGLLHPNWPENIFGLTHFFRPEFLLLPLLAFGSLFFVNLKPKTENIKGKSQNMYILLFALIGLVGIFLAKGANDPFGNIYLWLFDHVPGFIMFRDPTKWYLLIVISYAVLIPFVFKSSALHISQKIKTIKEYDVLLTTFLIGICLIFSLILPALLGQLGGTFKQHVLPIEYVHLEKFLDNQKGFNRTLWIPQVQRFGFFSNNHPAISAYDFYHTASISGVIDNVYGKNSLQMLQEAAIGYIIVPYDSQGELFLKDRKYSQNVFDNTYREVKNISWVSEIPGFGKMHVFQVPSPYDHFWTSGSHAKIQYTMISPTDYLVSVKNAQRGTQLIFSESFDTQWVAVVEGQRIFPKNFNGLNEFWLNRSGNYTIRVHYLPQDYMTQGIWISGVTLGFVGCLALFLHLKSGKIVE